LADVERIRRGGKSRRKTGYCKGRGGGGKTGSFLGEVEGSFTREKQEAKALAWEGGQECQRKHGGHFERRGRGGGGGRDLQSLGKGRISVLKEGVLEMKVSQGVNDPIKGVGGGQGRMDLHRRRKLCKSDEKKGGGGESESQGDVEKVGEKSRKRGINWTEGAV